MKNERPQESLLLKKGKKYFEVRDYTSAKNIYSSIVERNPKCIEAFFYLGNIFHATGEIGSAIRSFKKTLTLNPNHTDAAIGLSVLYNDIGRYDDAKNIFDKTNKRIKNGNSGIQDIHIDKILSIKHYELAKLYVKYNRYNESLKEFNKAIALDLENSDIRLQLAKLFAEKGLLSKSISELKKIIVDFPNCHKARTFLGVLYYKSKNILMAQAEWKKVLGNNPKDKNAAMYLKLSSKATEISATAVT